MTKQKVIPHLWFDKQAKDAANFYATVFPNSKVHSISTIRDTPSGDCDIVAFQVMGCQFMAISAGPLFKINPSISFMVNFDPAQDAQSEKNIDRVWNALAEGGKVLMPLQEYPWSKRYGWVQDKFGVSWQLILTNPQGEVRPMIVPTFLFTNEMCGKAKDAVNYWLSVFKDSKIGNMMFYGAGQEPNKEGTVMFSDFNIAGTWFVAMDGAGNHDFKFNEAISFIINCKDQQEIDYFWNKLSAVPSAEQCGWVKDKFGVSWQIIPENMGELMSKNPEKTTPAMLKMKKIVIADLIKAQNA